MDFVQLHKNFEEMTRNFPETFMDKFLDHGEEIIEQNQKQLAAGKTSENKNLKPKYTVDYEAIKTANGSLSSPVPDLYVTGGFYESIFMIKTNKLDEVIVGSEYTVNGFALAAKLEKSYGPIYGPIPSFLKKTAKKVLIEIKGDIIDGLKKI